MNGTHIPSSNGKRVRKVAAAAIPTEYTDATGREMIAYLCGFCAPGFAISSCKSCNGTGIYSLPKRSAVASAM